MRSMLRCIAVLLSVGVILATSGGRAGAAQVHRVGEVVSGTATVVDGSSFTIGSERFELWGIAAPVAGDWCHNSGRRWRPGRDAGAALRTCMAGKSVSCRVQRVASQFFAVRYVSECWTTDGTDLGGCMVRAGWATDYTCYSNGYYRDVETEARNKRAGLWQCDNGAPTPRWGRGGPDKPCEKEPYKPQGPGR